ncbi:alpha/beta hydrolase family esterase [Kribbella monticola]|uniref:alpha/beta hydrolase family esterase n=1 Tax=Kribbella monticola TaxID=2185285 RepID=UPI000DD4AC66|nr:esterase [Kribbella monticola]
MADVVEGELSIGGLVRTFTIRLPRVDSSARPLVLVLHGNHPQAGGWMMRDWTTFDREVDARGWVVAYPDGHGGSWADGRGVTSADEAGVDDVAFLRALIDHAASLYGTTPDLTVVAGASNGAFMAHRLALTSGDRVAVLAAVAGTLPASLSHLRPAYAVSALLIHGDADQLAPIGGGYSRRRGPNGELRGRTLSLEETADHYRTIDRCPPGRADGTRATFTGGVGGTQVAAWTVPGGGHSWPGAPTNPDHPEPTSTDFDAAAEICRFAAPLLLPADARRLS